MPWVLHGANDAASVALCRRATGRVTRRCEAGLDTAPPRLSRADGGAGDGKRIESGCGPDEWMDAGTGTTIHPSLKSGFAVGF